MDLNKHISSFSFRVLLLYVLVQWVSETLEYNSPNAQLILLVTPTSITLSQLKISTVKRLTWTGSLKKRHFYSSIITIEYPLRPNCSSGAAPCPTDHMRTTVHTISCFIQESASPSSFHTSESVPTSLICSSIKI